MEIKSTIGVIDNENAIEISKAIVETHKYYLQNVAVLNDRERGYFFNEYFPSVKKYLQDPLGPLEPCGSVEPEAENHEALDELEEFRHRRGVVLSRVNLSYIPEKILGVYVANNLLSFQKGLFFSMEPPEYYIVNPFSGGIHFNGFFTGKGGNENSVFDDYEINDEFSIFVNYKARQPRALTMYGKRPKPYQVGEDGE